MLAAEKSIQQRHGNKKYTDNTRAHMLNSCRWLNISKSWNSLRPVSLPELPIFVVSMQPSVVSLFLSELRVSQTAGSSTTRSKWRFIHLTFPPPYNLFIGPKPAANQSSTDHNRIFITLFIHLFALYFISPFWTPLLHFHLYGPVIFIPQSKRVRNEGPCFEFR